MPYQNTLTHQFTTFAPSSEQQQYQRWTSAIVLHVVIRVRIGDFVGLSDGSFGRVLEILEQIVPWNTKRYSARFLIQEYDLSGEYHHECPVIHGLGSYAVIAGRDIQGGINCQHWCSASCKSGKEDELVLEGRRRTIPHDAGIHSDEKRFLINVFCMQHEWVRNRFPRQYPSLESTNLEQHCRDAFDQQSEELDRLEAVLEFQDDIANFANNDAEDDVIEDPSQPAASGSGQRRRGRPRNSRGQGRRGRSTSARSSPSRSPISSNRALRPPPPVSYKSQLFEWPFHISTLITQPVAYK
ncbi:hypothetical protein DFS34DRAFT_692281 [Phlyctochytrium arcticum]|nr:hypothetical protein DFS34DRAFT_692281 [Phlyctochytrium arcticum]